VKLAVNFRRLVLLAAVLALSVFGFAAPAKAANHSPSYYLPGTSACPGQLDYAASNSTQIAAMGCLINYARRREGVRTLDMYSKLHDSANKKKQIIFSCGEFSHYACGSSFLYPFRWAGYLTGGWSVGENLGYAYGYPVPPRLVFNNWLHSPTHLNNLLRSAWRQQGLARGVGPIDGASSQTVLWVSHFGYHNQ
jgi:uncharacterized protein YkwD